MFKFFEKKDAHLESDVKSELLWDSSVTSDKINVKAKDGVVTLTGTVPHYSEKVAAELAVQRVTGVRGIADEMEVRIEESYGKGDSEIAKAAADAIEWNYSAPKNVKVTVDKGWVRLTGEAEWDFERNAAKNAVSSLLGVVGVTNDIVIKSSVRATDVKTLIEDALKRSVESEAKGIQVAVNGNRVVLSGSVHSLAEMYDAGTAAWNAPGVLVVENTLKIA